jgi:hypothetical protein
VGGPACQRPTTAHDRVSRPACTHARGDTMLAQSPATTSRDAITAEATVPCAPRPYPSTVPAGEALHGSTPMSCPSPFAIANVVPRTSPCQVAIALLLGAECRCRLEPLHRASSRRDCLSCTTEPSLSPRTHDQSPKRSRRRPPGRESTTPSTSHLRPPSTTGDATSSSVVTPSCSTTRSRPP